MKAKTDISEGVNRGDYRQFLISLGIGILFLYLIITIIFGSIITNMHIIPNILLILLLLEFTWRKIINPISTKTVQMFQNMTLGHSIKESLIETIPKENKNEAKRLKKEEKKKLNKRVQQELKRIQRKIDKEELKTKKHKVI